MSDSDPTRSQWADEASNPEMPWTDPQMPCVYCGRAIPRDSQRCPECRTTYSVAVRRASRQVEGAWFYLESRNPSNRGVDFPTMLKLIEKGRLKRNSVVRGPTTHQDWMYAAEVPLLSKHLGVCPHCFGPASAEQEFCDHCQRSLDERPPRLRPGASEPGAESYFPERDAMEAELAEALKTHDMAKAASEVAVAEEEPGPLDEILGRDRSDVAAVAPRRPRGRSPRQRRAKPHVVVLLTIVTVIPLGFLMLNLPVERLFGDPSVPGSMAERVKYNRYRFWGWSVDDDGGKPGGATAGPSVERELERARTASRNNDYATAMSIYDQLIQAHAGTPVAELVERERSQLEDRIGRQKETAQVLEKAGKVQAAYDAGHYVDARTLLADISLHERSIAADAGVDLRGLELKITAAIDKEEEGRQQEIRRAAVRNLLARAAREVREKKFDAALATYQEIANKYPSDDLPQGVNLSALIEETRQKKAGKPPSPPPPPQPADDKTRAQQLWAEAGRLEGKKEFREAIKRCEEILALPEDVHPEGIMQKIEDLKKKAVEKEKLDFFFGDGS